MTEKKKELQLLVRIVKEKDIPRVHVYCEREVYIYWGWRGLRLVKPRLSSRTSLISSKRDQVYTLFCSSIGDFMMKVQFPRKLLTIIQS